LWQISQILTQEKLNRLLSLGGHLQMADPIVGDFSPDGKQIAIQALNRKGEVIPGVRWVDSTPAQQEVFAVRKNGYVTLTGQDVPADYDPNSGTIWQTVQGIWSLPAGEIEYFGTSAYLAFLDDVLDDSTLQGIVLVRPTEFDVNEKITYQGYTRSAINEIAFLASVDAYDINGSVIESHPWHSFFFSFGPTFQHRHRITINPKIDRFIWGSTGDDALDIVSHGDRPREYPISDLASGFFLHSGSRYIRRVQWTRIGDFYDVRILFWPGSSGSEWQIAFSSAFLPENEAPTLLLDESGLSNIAKEDGSLTGGRIYSRLFIAAGKRLIDASEVSTEAAAGDSRPLTSDAAFRAIDTQARLFASDRSLVRDQATQIANILRYDQTLTTWLTALTNFTGPGIYAKIEEVPAGVDVAVIRPANGTAAIHVRVGGGALSPLATTTYTTVQQQTEAYDKGIAFVASLLSKAGSTISTAEIDKIRQDISDLRIADDKIRQEGLAEVAEIATQSVPSPVWPDAFVPANFNGSLWVRKGESVTVAATRDPVNPDSTKHYITQSFGTTERSKSYIARASIKSDVLAGIIDLSFQNSAGGTIAQSIMSHNGTTWVASGNGTVTIDKGFAVLSLPVTFSASLNSRMFCLITPGTVQVPCFYDPSSATYLKSVTGVKLTDKLTGTQRDILDADKAKLSAVESKVDGLLKYIAADRAPLATDIWPEGVVWGDTTYGTVNPAKWMSKGGGVWASLNKVTLTKIRINAAGVMTSFTVLNTIRILKADGTQYGNVWQAGASSGAAGFPAAGADYLAQPASPPTNGSGWFDLVPKSGTVLAGISGMVANYRELVDSTKIVSIDLTFSNGFTKVIPVNITYPLTVSLNPKVLASATDVRTTIAPISFPIGSDVAGAGVDAYTKTESDAKFATKADIPSSPPLSLYGGAVQDIAELRGLVTPRNAEHRFVTDANKSYVFRKRYIEGPDTGPVAFDKSGGWFESPFPYVQNQGWIGVLSATQYQRKLVGGTIATLSVEVADLDDPSLWQSFFLDDFLTGFSPSAFYGGLTRFIDIAMPTGGRSTRLVVSLQPDNKMLLNPTNPAGTRSGLIRKVLINGMPGDMILPNHASYATNAAVQAVTDRVTFSELTGTTTAGTAAGVGVLTAIPYTVPAGYRVQTYILEIQAANGWWYQSTFNPGAETDYRFRQSRTPTQFNVFTSPDSGVVSAINNRPYRVGITFVKV
jgi:hypothetical protein